jgi:hypothetical protein
MTLCSLWLCGISRLQTFDFHQQVARSPSSPSSPSAGARTLASTTITVFAQGLHSLRERDATSGSAAGTFQHFVHRRRGRLLDKALAQVLLERLASCCCSPPEHGMSFRRDIFYLHAWHGAILAPEAPQ